MWFYQTLGQEFGPLPWEELVELNSSGVLDGQDPVRSENSSEWLPFEKARSRLSGERSNKSTISGKSPSKESGKGIAELPGGHWYYRDADREQGPFSLPDLIGLAKAGELCANTEVRFGAGGWRKAGSIGQLMAAIPFAPGGNTPPAVSKRVSADQVPIGSKVVSIGPGPSIEKHEGPVGDWGNCEKRSSGPDRQLTEEDWLAGIPAEGRESLPAMESLDDLMRADSGTPPDSFGEVLDLSDDENSAAAPEEWVPRSDSQSVSSPYQVVPQNGLEEATNLDEILAKPSEKQAEIDGPIGSRKTPQPISKDSAGSTFKPAPVVGVKKLTRKTTKDLSNLESEAEQARGPTQEPISREPAASKAASVVASIPQVEQEAETVVTVPKSLPLTSPPLQKPVNSRRSSISFPRVELGSLVNWKLISAVFVLAAVLVWQFVPWADVFANDQASHAKLVEIFSGYRRAASQPDEAKWEAFSKKTKADCDLIAKEIQKGMSYPRDSRRLLLQVAKNSIPNLIRRCRSGKCPEVAQTEYLLNRAAWLMKLPGATEPQPISLLETNDAKK